MNVRLRILTFAVYLFAAVSGVATDWSGTISSNTVWTKSASPHTWGGNLTIGAGNRLSIEPGVRVIPGQNANLYNYGSIHAEGLPEDPIRIGALSFQAPADTLYFFAGGTNCIFRHCMFEHMNQIRIDAATPVLDPLFEHCVFRDFSGDALHLCGTLPARVLHCIFQPRPGKFGIRLQMIGSMTGGNVPTIMYNAFTQNGLQLIGGGSASYSLGNYEFFRWNRVASGIGIQVVPCQGFDCGGLLSDVKVTDCDLGNCSTSLYLTGSGVHLQNMDISRSTLSKLVNGSGNLHGLMAARSNYWGTVDVSVISNRMFSAAYTNSHFQPVLATNPFPQADVDHSDADQWTFGPDADLVKRHLLGATNLTAGQLLKADVDRDGVITVRDALLIDSYVNGTLWKLPNP
ncbi:MAG: dockerin type I repeat-containing protein [Verrucomicrobia bacterium]|nr:dockerin type I repeat-containing protein [Verrucomicrobiota bacterium]